MHPKNAYSANSEAVQRFSTVENGQPMRDSIAASHLQADR
ncbi:hypothetical protein SAMN04244553_0526 [Nocardia amikacinitolerans]|uniref:Uncharacterized protein n=1 Tax=Nocardia amikacinitolerans TaxID=756689 RepID=A0A285KSK5_9NOCA|nr:hypothetical protein [Nocardia amikacinitolerans]MCP2293950.1 hypothetical protein [Nocardia amikacinitolerans]SNY75624.1 hypothetical protein SAMN04244553_0526 [Nocardia amikacinitolerans]